MEKKMLTVMAVVLMAATLSFGSITVSFTPHDQNIQAGDSFDLAVNIIATEGEMLEGITFFMAVDPAGSGQFTLASRSIAGSIFNEVITTTITEVLSPGNTKDLGAFDNTFVGQEGGTAYVCTLTMNSNALVPLGTYTFTPTGLVVIDTDFMEYVGVQAAPALVNVIPEPVSLVLLALGGLGLLRRKS